MSGPRKSGREKRYRSLLATLTESPFAMTEAARDEQASRAGFEAFYLRTARILHGSLCRLTGDHATADEVLQEAYIRMINAAAMDERHRYAYLYTTATNILRDHWRKQIRARA